MLNSFFALQIYLTYQKGSIYLLPDAKLFVVLTRGVLLFDYSNVQETTSLPSMYDPEDTVTPLWANFTLHLSQSAVSFPYFYTAPPLDLSFTASSLAYMA
jgi:hypothetical protein